MTEETLKLPRRSARFKAFSARALERLRRAAAGLGISSRDAARGYLELLAPGFCRQCGTGLESAAEAFCAGCISRVAWLGNACPRCALPSGLAAEGTEALPRAPSRPCAACAVRPPPFAAAASGALYTETIRTAVLAYKFRADLGVLPLLRQALQRACESPALAEHVRAAKSAGAVVPVPLHPLKRWMRGRDPILELAQEVSTSLDVPLLRALKKVRWTPSQARLSRDARRRNLRGAFRVRSRARVPESVILVDDVLTTATTVARCARELRRAGARRVVALTVARSGAEG